ncbi:hypothetical protein ER45_030575 (plasmid) [Bacillus mycoides]|nr:hypothetical protein ER45_030575 [Bacillus mycoides]
MSFTFDISSFMSNTASIEQSVLQASKTSVKDCLDDLARKASNAAPVEDGDLRRSHKKTTKVSATGIEGEVTFSMIGNNGFNYALAMHEWSYTPRNGGGRKYLEKPLNENRTRYLGMIGEAIRKGLR